MRRSRLERLPLMKRREISIDRNLHRLSSKYLRNGRRGKGGTYLSIIDERGLLEERFLKAFFVFIHNYIRHALLPTLIEPNPN